MQQQRRRGAAAAAADTAGGGSWIGMVGGTDGDVAGCVAVAAVGGGAAGWKKQEEY